MNKNFNDIVITKAVINDTNKSLKTKDQYESHTLVNIFFYLYIFSVNVSIERAVVC